MKSTLTIKKTENDTTEFWINDKGELHNETGPALVSKETGTFYCLNGKPLTKEKWKNQIRILKLQQIYK